MTSFLPACATSKFQKSGRRAVVVAIPKLKKPVADPKSYRLISLLCVPYKILDRLINVRVKPIVDPLLLGSRLGLDGEGQPWIRLFCLLKTSRIRLRPRRRLMPCLSIRQLLATWSGTVVSPASCSGFYRISTWSG